MFSLELNLAAAGELWLSRILVDKLSRLLADVSCPKQKLPGVYDIIARLKNAYTKERNMFPTLWKMYSTFWNCHQLYGIVTQIYKLLLLFRSLSFFHCTYFTCNLRTLKYSDNECQDDTFQGKEGGPVLTHPILPECLVSTWNSFGLLQSQRIFGGWAL